MAEKAKTSYVERPAKTRCPICHKLFKCVEAHSLIKHGKWLPPQWPPAQSECQP